MYSTDNPTLVQNNDTVSFLRPFGALSSFDERIDIGSFNRAESSFVKWAERTGYVMEYCTNYDLDNDPSHSFITSYRFLVTSGHDEYWSNDERVDIEKEFIQKGGFGGNAAFLSGNVCYWRATYTPNRTRMWVGKNTGSNYRWRFLSPPQPEARFLGVQWDEIFNAFFRRGGVDTVRLPSHWLLKGTNLGYGSVYGYGKDSYFLGAMGGEVDNTVPGTSPSNIEVISSAVIRDTSNIIAARKHEAAFYVDTSSNARVFGAGLN